MQGGTWADRGVDMTTGGTKTLTVPISHTMTDPWTLSFWWYNTGYQTPWDPGLYTFYNSSVGISSQYVGGQMLPWGNDDRPQYYRHSWQGGSSGLIYVGHWHPVVNFLQPTLMAIRFDSSAIDVRFESNFASGTEWFAPYTLPPTPLGFLANADRIQFSVASSSGWKYNTLSNICLSDYVSDSDLRRLFEVAVIGSTL